MSHTNTHRHATRRRAVVRVLVALLALSGSSIHAQSVEREIFLESGWNSVWLDVEPASTAPAEVFADIEYESIWTWQQGPDSDPAIRWLAHHRDTPFLDSLFAVQGARGYLIRMRQAGTLRVTGKPASGTTALPAGSYALVGTTVDPARLLTFERWLSLSGVAESVTAVHTLSSGLAEVQVRELTGAHPVTASTAFWLFASRRAELTPPVRVRTSIGGLRFRDGMDAVRMGVEVPPAVAPESPRSVTIRALRSATGGSPDWLEFRVPGDPEEIWSPLSNGVTLTIPAGETIAELSLRPVREAPAGGGGGGAPDDNCDALEPQAVVQVSDDQGNLTIVGAALEEARLDGLWIGIAKLGAVSAHPEVSSVGEPVPAPVASLALIVEIPTGDDRKAGVPIRLLDSAVVSVAREGLEHRVRLESVLFHEPVALSGSLAACGRDGEVAGEISMDALHDLNPYRHRYHPEHEVGYSILRRIELRFTGEDELGRSLGLTAPGGLFGEYKEEITDAGGQPLIPGVPIVVSGSFRLRRVAGLDSVE